MLCALCTIGAQSQNIGRPERSNPGNLLKNFQTPPKGYGEVPFYWWMGDTLTREHLLGHLEILKNKGITVKQTIEVGEILEPHNISSKDPFRLDDEGEKCVEIIKKEINKRME